MSCKGQDFLEVKSHFAVDEKNEITNFQKQMDVETS